MQGYGIGLVLVGWKTDTYQQISYVLSLIYQLYPNVSSKYGKNPLISFVSLIYPSSNGDNRPFKKINYDNRRYAKNTNMHVRNLKRKCNCRSCDPSVGNILGICRD